MTRDEIKNTPELIDYLLDESVIADSRKKLHKRMNEICNLAIKALEQEPCDVFDEYGNYKYPSDVELMEPNTATSLPFEDAISRQAVLDMMQIKMGGKELYKAVYDMPPVNPQAKTGCEGCIYEKTGDNSTYPCSHCGRCYTDKYKGKNEE